MKSWTVKQLALEEKNRVPGPTYSLFKLVFEVVFLLRC